MTVNASRFLGGCHGDLADSSKRSRRTSAWSLEDLAREAALSKGALIQFESGEKSLEILHRPALRETFERAGVRFLLDGGVALRKLSQPRS
jgi:hypothetical protein